MGKEYRVVLDVPGATKDGIEVTPGPVKGTLSIRATVRVDEDAANMRRLVNERVSNTGPFARILPVAWDADVERAKTSITDGVLSVTIPKVSGSSTPASSKKS